MRTGTGSGFLSCSTACCTLTATTGTIKKQTKMMKMTETCLVRQSPHDCCRSRRFSGFSLCLFQASLGGFPPKQEYLPLLLGPRGPGAIPPTLSLHFHTFPPSTLSFRIFYYFIIFPHFPCLLTLSIFLLFYPFPFYWNSPTPFSGWMS